MRTGRPLRRRCILLKQKRMKKILAILLLLAASVASYAQKSIRVEAPEVVGLDEQFNVTFIIDGEGRPSSFSWSQGSDFRLVWGPQQGSSTSIQIINGKRSKSSQYTYTYVLSPLKAGKFRLPSASATVGGNTLTSNAAEIEVVADAASSSSSSAGQPSGGQSSGQTAATGDVPAGDLFLKLSLSRTDVVVGEPITATLKLYQRVDIAGFEDARFPTFDGFWSQETAAPSNIQFKRESLGDKIYEAAVIRSYVLIPQKTGDLQIDPAELVCLVNLRTSRQSNSIFDDFFDMGYKTVRKRISTPAVKVHVRSLPSGAPASFGGGVGSFTIDAHLSADTLSTHDAASLTVTVSGKGNVSLLEAPKVKFHPDMEVYDVKSVDGSDKSRGGTSGSKVFEFPFIPRSAGDFTIDPIEYSYYDVSSGKYVTLKTEPIAYHVKKGKASAGGASSSAGTLQGVDRKGVRNLAEDIRYIDTKAPDFGHRTSFFVGRPAYAAVAAVLLALAAGLWFWLRKSAAMRSDVAAMKNRKATRMAMNRLKLAGEYRDKNLASAFYEELHRALLGFASDKLNIGAEDLSKENIAERFKAAGVSSELMDRFTSLLDACEFARYSPEGEGGALSSRYSDAVDVISSIDSAMKTKSSSFRSAAMVIALLLCMGGVSHAAQDYPDSLWNAGVEAYGQGRWDEASAAWESLAGAGFADAKIWYNAGNARFKAGDYPAAILDYERALKADPSSSDARFNLEYAQNMIQDKIDAVPEFIFKTWLRKLSYAMPSNSWAWLSLLLFAGALALALLFLFSARTGRRRAGFYGGIVLLLLALMSFGFARWQYSDFGKADGAIVMREVTSVKSSPAEASSTDLFVLHGGTKVRLLDTVGEWNNIALADGRQGWIRSSDIEVI